MGPVDSGQVCVGSRDKRDEGRVSVLSWVSHTKTHIGLLGQSGHPVL